MKNKVYIALVVSIFVIAISVSKIWFHPWFHQQVLSSLQNIPDTKIQWEKLNVQSWLLKAELHQVQIQYPEIQKNFHPQKIVFQVAPWTSLIKRKIFINISISNLNYVAKIKDRDQMAWKEIFNFVQNLPIHHFVVERLQWKAYIPRGSISSPITRFHATNYSEKIQVKVDSDLRFQKSKLHLQSHFFITEQKIHFAALQLTDNESSASINGEWKDWPLMQNISLNIETKWDIQSALPWISLWKDTPLSTEGVWNIRAQMNYSTKKKWEGGFDIQIQNLRFKNLFLSQMKAQGKIDQKGAQWNLIHLEKKDGWTSFIEDAKLEWNSKKSFQFNHFSHIKNFKDIEAIFNWNTSFQFTTPLEGKCKGELENLQIKCSIDAKLDNFSIIEKNTLNITLYPLQIKGDWSWNASNDEFFTQGVVKGYKSQIYFKGSETNNNKLFISFHGNFDTFNFQNFFDQKIQGQTELTKGTLEWDDNQKTLSIQSHLKIKNFKWNQINFGNATTQLYLTPSQVQLKNIKAQKGQSRYTGDISFLIQKEWMNAKMQSKYLFLEDIVETLDHFLPLSLSVVGKGRLKLFIDSPLNTKKLNYKITSQFKNIKIQDDFFKSLTLNINSKKGRATITKGLLEKIKGRISLTGRFNTFSKKLNLKINGQNLFLEKSQTTQNWALLSGTLQFQSLINGTFQSPVGHIKIQLDSLRHQLVSLGNSQVHFDFKSQKFKGSAQLFNQQIDADNIQFSLWDKSSPISFKAKFKNWNFISLWPAKIVSNQIYSNVTGETSLSFPWNKPQLMTGHLDLKKLHIQYGTYPLKMLSPSYITFNKGRFFLKDSLSEWSSHNSKVSFKTSGKSQTRVQGLMRLEFLNIFLPFIKNVTGDLKLKIKFNNNLNNWNPTGTFKISNSTLNITSYIDILQSLELEGSLRNEQIHIEEMTAKTSYNGEVEGTGMVGFFNKDLFPIDLNFKLKRSFGIYINESIQGFGYGSLRIYGDRIPYLMSGKFFVQSGYFKEELQSLEETLPEPSDSKDVFHWDINLVFQQPFSLENTLFTASIDGFLNLKGKFTNPITLGEIRFIPNSILHLREYDFQLESGWLQYKSQPLLDPQFQLVGNTHFEEIKLDENQKETITLYEITANVSGKADDFEFKLNSQPSLPEEEILSMMALGARSIGFTNPSQQVNQIASYSGYKIGSMLFQDTIGKELNKLLGVQIYITSYINSQKNAPSSKIELHKRWFKKLNTSYTQSIDEDYNSFKLEYNLAPDFSILGSWENDKEENQEDSNLGIELEYKLDF